MEIHAPHAVRSLKDLLIELGVIVAGILIALGLEGVSERVHNRRLVEEARTSLLAEVGDNQQKIREAEPNLKRTAAELEKMVSQLRQIESDRKTPVHRIAFSYAITTLNATSWQTALATGAISHMGYPVAKEYTEIYEAQRQFLSMQERTIQTYMPLGVISAVFEHGTQRITDAQLQEIERSAAIALMNVQALESFSKELSAQYSRLLKER